MDHLTGELLYHHLAAVAHLNHRLGQFRRLPDNADDVSDRVVTVSPKDKIGSGKKEEVQDFVIYMGHDLHELTQLPARRRRIGSEAAVHGLVGSSVVLPGANAADPRHDPGNFFRRPSFDEFFETSHGHNMEARIGHVAILIQLDGNASVPFNAGNRLKVYHPLPARMH
jgi:hypothetical protein